MASTQSVIEIIFNGIDNASETTRAVSNSLSGLADTGKNITQPFADATTGVLKFESGMLAAGAAVIGFSINAADKFDIAFREISTLIDAPIEGLQNFRSEILAYAADSTQSIDQVTAATYNAISQGVDYQQSLQAVSAAEKLAVAGKADLNITLQSLLGTLNAYGKGMDSANQFSDVFFTTVRLGKTTIPELSASISTVTGSAVLGGVSFEELGAAIATVTAAGAPTSEAITRINAVLGAIIKPSSEAAKLAEDLGIQFDIQALKSKGLSGVLSDVATKTGGAGDKMAVLFGSTEALNAANVLAVSSSDKFKSNLDAMSKAAGATDAAFAKMKDATDTLGQAFEVALINLGTPLLDEFNGIEDALADLAKSFSTAINSGAFAPLISVVETNLGSIRDLFSNVAKNLPAALAGVDFKPFANELQTLFNSISNLFNFKGLQTDSGLKDAIQTVVNLLTQTTAYSSGAVNSLGPFVSSLGDIVKTISEIDIGAIAKIGEIGGYALAANIAFGAFGATLAGISGAAGLLPRLATVLATVRTEAALLTTVIGAGGAGGLVAALGTAGLAGAFGLLTYEFGRWININDKLIPDSWAGYKDATLGTVLADLAESIGLMGSAAEKSAPKLQNLPQAFSEETEAAAATRKEIDQWLDAQERAAKVAGDSKAEISALSENFKKLGYAYNEVTGELTKLNNEQEKGKDLFALADNIKIEKYKTDISGAVAINQALVTSYSQIGGGSVKATGAFASVSTAAADQAKKVDEATKKAQEFQAKMEEIASNERIKTIEAYVNLNVADLESQAKRVEATFDSINTTVNSTGDLLGSLFGSLASADTYTQLRIIEQIEAENKRRDAALELQRKVTEAEIENIKAKTRALDRGDSLIKIDGTGLAPQLEAFMWEILKAIRVRANADFADYLLGVT